MSETGKNWLRSISLKAKKGVPLSLTQEEIEQFAVQGNLLRGDVINELIHLEHKLEGVINSYFVVDSNKQTMFFEHVLKQRFFTLNEKIRIVLQIADSLVHDSEEIKKLKSIFGNVQRLRNKLAHGDFVLDANNKNASIEYHKGGKKVSELFNQKRVKEFEDNLFKINVFLDKF